MNILELAILKKMVGGGGGSGTDNYNDLSNLPQINGETLAGNKTAENLGLQDALTFDSAPTEDSTNPVESGGVYNALAGKQDNLTFDDDPTENSTNPVKSGGVYSALAGKQDNLTFDGVYNASTNKAATESTVTNAIAGLDVSDFSVDADETISSISETDGKINVTKQDIAIASNQVTTMTGYTKPSSAPATPAIQTSDTANQAFGKLEFKADTNQTNILYSLEHGAKNLFRWNKWVNDCTVVGGTKSIDAYGKLILTSSSTDCYTEYSGFAYPDVEIAVKENEQYVLMWEYSRLAGESRGIVYVVFEGSTGTTSASASAELKKLEFTTPSGTTGLRIYINQTANGMQEQYYDFMVCSKVIWDTLGHDYQPPSVSNYDLTVLEAEDRAALVEQVDDGAKNKFDISTATFDNQDGQFSVTYNGDSATIKRISGSATLTTPNFSVRLNPGTYVLSGCPSTGSDSTYRLDLRDPFGPVVDGSIDYGSGSSAFKISETKTYKIALRFANNYTVPAEGITITPMICTEADWKISQNYAPFALPNTDLTRMMTPFFTVPINHNMIYRGQNLGETFTEAQDTALLSGNFTDLYLGDYWTKAVTIPAFYELTTAEPSDWSTNYTSYYTKSGDTYTPVSGDTAPTWAADTYYERLVPAQTVTLKAVIADFDTFYAGYASGYAAINSHHAAVVVHGFNNVVWNKTNTTAGGYVNSLIHKWLVASVLPQIETWFGSAKVLAHQKLLTNAITGNAASGWAWSSQKISLLSENQMYGSKVWGNSKAANGGYEPGEAFKHLNVFNHIDASLLFGNKNIWLRDIASAEGSAGLGSYGYAGDNAASATWIAPAALILLS